MRNFSTLCNPKAEAFQNIYKQQQQSLPIKFSSKNVLAIGWREKLLKRVSRDFSPCNFCSSIET
jgi:hypothetical protein